jgi:membrane protein CcdC involved in cytochrome C biogenesis
MPHGVSFVVIGVLVAWSIYRRIRRTVTFQPLRTKRLVFRMVALGAIGILYLVGIALHPAHLLFALLGLVIGGVLAYFAIRTTQFEQRDAVWFYRPNVWIGAVLVVLFLGRIVYRGYEVSKQIHTGLQSQQMSGQPFGSTADPFTTAFLFALIAYYIGYYVFLIRNQHRLQAGD